MLKKKKTEKTTIHTKTYQKQNAKICFHHLNELDCECFEEFSEIGKVKILKKYYENVNDQVFLKKERVDYVLAPSVSELIKFFENI